MITNFKLYESKNERTITYVIDFNEDYSIDFDPDKSDGEDGFYYYTTNKDEVKDMLNSYLSINDFDYDPHSLKLVDERTETMKYTFQINNRGVLSIFVNKITPFNFYHVDKKSKEFNL